MFDGREITDPKYYSTEALRRDFWLGVGGVIKKTKDFMQPLLHGWLVAGIEGTLTILKIKYYVSHID